MHELELERIRIAFELEHLQLSDAVLGGKAAAEILDEIMNRALRLGLDRQQLRGRAARALVDVEVQVAVAQVPVCAKNALRHVVLDPAARDFDEAGYLRYRDCDVVLDVGAFLALRLGDGFAQTPEGGSLPLVDRDARVRDPA